MGTTPRKILILDSQSIESDRLKWELPREDYTITFAASLTQAMELVSQCDYDLALIEVDYPRRKTLGLLKTLHENRPGTKVVMMTDYGDDELWIEVINRGACDLLTRPVRGRDLAQRI